jgi:protein involved in polysaccharide export with SLBB domain
VFSLKDFESIKKITVIGEVNNPNNFDYKLGMTVRDAIQLSNGFTNDSNKNTVKIIRNISLQNLNNITEEFFVDFTDELNFNNIKLFPDDIIAVSKLPFSQPTQSYSVRGKVSVESSYPISFKTYSIVDAFRDNIRLVDNSSSEGIYIERNSIMKKMKTEIKHLLEK